MASNLELWEQVGIARAVPKLDLAKSPMGLNGVAPAARIPAEQGSRVLPESERKSARSENIGRLCLRTSMAGLDHLLEERHQPRHRETNQNPV
jgi:hypothetical protein